VNSAEAPKSFADLLDPKWKGKIVKAHPSYSGTIMTSTYQMVRELGWTILKSSRNSNFCRFNPLPTRRKKVVLGERPVMADGNESNVLLLKEAGQPIEVVYPARARRRSFSRRPYSRLRRTRTRRACSKIIFSPSRGRSSSSILAACVLCMRSVKDRPGGRHCRRSRSGRTIPPPSRPRRGD
jgi:hypothetical protein